MSALVGILGSKGQAPEKHDAILLKGVRSLRDVRYETEIALANGKLVLVEEERRSDEHQVTRHPERSAANGRTDVSLGDATLGEALRVFVFRDGREVSLERGLLSRRTFYFGWRSDGSLVFASRIDAVLSMLDRRLELSPVGLALYLTQYGMPAPWTLVEGVWKVGPGRRVLVRPDGEFRVSDGVVGAALPPVRSKGLPATEVRELIQEAISRRADRGREAGILLSGGLDSSIVLSQLMDLDLRPSGAYILRYTDPIFAKYDWDARYAWLVAWKRGVDMQNVPIDPGVPLRVLLGRLQRQADEPVADPALVPLYLASREATRRGIRILWDGRGADELFAAPQGAAKLDTWRWWFSSPGSLRKAMGSLASTALAGRRSRRWAKWAAPDLATSVFWHESVLRPDELETVGLFDLDPVLEYFSGLARRTGDDHPGGLIQRTEWEAWLAEQNQPLAETVARLTGVRFESPYLDESLVRQAMEVPFRARAPRGQRKMLLRKAFGHEIPAEILRRRKRGLGTPVGWWVQQLRASSKNDLQVVREAFGDSVLDWAGVGRLLENAQTHPSVCWLLLSMLQWLRLHLVEPSSAKSDTSASQLRLSPRGIGEKAAVSAGH